MGLGSCSYRREGIVPDLYNFLAEHLNFTYTLQLSSDGKWGTTEKVRVCFDLKFDVGSGFGHMISLGQQIYIVLLSKVLI